MESEQELADFCKVFSAEIRVKILNLLKNRSLCVGALTARLGVTQGAISQHLRILRSAGLLKAEKKGYFIHYSINEDVLKKKKAAIERFLDTGQKAESQKPGREKSKGGDKRVVKRRNARRPRSRKTGRMNGPQGR